jgi:hypothetical protein
MERREGEGFVGFAGFAGFAILLGLWFCWVIILSLVRKNEARKHAGCDESQGRKKLHTGSFL